MKKTYIAPELATELVLEETMLAASITKIGGDSGIELSKDEAPTEADVKENFFGETLFD